MMGILLSYYYYYLLCRENSIWVESWERYIVKGAKMGALCLRKCGSISYRIEGLADSRGVFLKPLNHKPKLYTEELADRSVRVSQWK